MFTVCLYLLVKVSYLSEICKFSLRYISFLFKIFGFYLLVEYVLLNINGCFIYKKCLSDGQNMLKGEKEAHPPLRLLLFLSVSLNARLPLDAASLALI